MLQGDWSWAKHYVYTHSIAYRILGLLKFLYVQLRFTPKKVVCFTCSLSTDILLPTLATCCLDIRKLEEIQCRATQFILGTSGPLPDYKQNLIMLNLFPLMYYFKIGYIMFMVYSLKKKQNDHFNILKYVDIQNSRTWSPE